MDLICRCKVIKYMDGDEDMIVTTLHDIEENAKKNSSKKDDMIINFLKDLEKRGLKKGRVRPKNKTEQQILNSFERK